MREFDVGFFHHAQRMSRHHARYYRTHPLSDKVIRQLEEMAAESLRRQQQIEAEDTVSFEQYLNDYFAQP
jgi:glutamate--cysteine ligase